MTSFLSQKIAAMGRKKEIFRHPINSAIALGITSNKKSIRAFSCFFYGYTREKTSEQVMIKVKKIEPILGRSQIEDIKNSITDHNLFDVY